MKKSTAVPLLLLGTLALAGCGQSADTEQVQVSQNAYASREDCVKDWGEDYRHCQSSTSHGGGYVGPRYYWNHATGAPMVIDQDGTHRSASGTPVAARGVTSTGMPVGSAARSTVSTTTSVARGGFGGSAHAAAAGGHGGGSSSGG